MTTIPSDSGVLPGGARRAADASRIEISERSPAHIDAARLLHAFHTEQVDRYGFADPVDLRPGDYAAPHGLFAVVYEEHRPVGCGGYRWFDRAAHTVEVKKVYVTPAARGHGLGRALLAWLAPIWADVTRSHATRRYESTVRLEDWLLTVLACVF